MTIDKNIITNKNQLVDHILSGCKPSNEHKIGIEFENFLFTIRKHNPVSYNNIAKILNDFNPKIWQGIFEKENIIGLSSNFGNVTLEPAGQLEYSSIPAKDINEINNFIKAYFKEVLPILQAHKIGLVSLGYNPKHNIEDLPLMPKERVDLMHKYMPRVGTLGQNMMKATATIQVNLDYSSEPDLIKKFRVLMAVQPIIGAMYSNSAIVEGMTTSYKSYRTHVWQHTDNARSGLLDFALDDNFSVEQYVDYALMTPMYFIKRGEKYINTAGITFKDFMIGKYKFPNIIPSREDFELHLSTLFPDVRIKTYLETRAADCPDITYYNSLPALLAGLVYDESSLDNALSLVKNWKYADLQQFKLDTIKDGLNAKLYDNSAKNIATELLEIAKVGLKKRNLNEERYLQSLETLIHSGKTLAEEKVAIFCDSKNVDDFLEKIMIK